MAELVYRAYFSSTDDVDGDAELIRLEDTPHTLDEIREICRRFKVWARYADPETGELVGELPIGGG